MGNLSFPLIHECAQAGRIIFPWPFYSGTRFGKFVSISTGRKRRREFQSVDRLPKGKV